MINSCTNIVTSHLDMAEIVRVLCYHSILNSNTLSPHPIPCKACWDLQVPSPDGDAVRTEMG